MGTIPDFPEHLVSSGYLPLVQNLHHHHQTPFQCSLTGIRHCLKYNPLDIAVSFSFFSFSPPCNHWNRWLFLLGVGRAMWWQCRIVIIADSDTLLAGSSLLLRQLPFNKKGKGEQRTGTAEKRRVWVPARARLQQINAPTLSTWKGPEKFWLSLIKGNWGFAAALSLGRTKLLESSLFWFFFFKWLSWKKKFIQGGSLVTTSWKHLKNLEN